MLHARLSLDQEHRSQSLLLPTSFEIATGAQKTQVPFPGSSLETPSAASERRFAEMWVTASSVSSVCDRAIASRFHGGRHAFEILSVSMLTLISARASHPLRKSCAPERMLLILASPVVLRPCTRVFYTRTPLVHTPKTSVDRRTAFVHKRKVVVHTRTIISHTRTIISHRRAIIVPARKGLFTRVLGPFITATR